MDKKFNPSIIEQLIKDALAVTPEPKSLSINVFISEGNISYSCTASNDPIISDIDKELFGEESPIEFIREMKKDQAEMKEFMEHAKTSFKALDGVAASQVVFDNNGIHPDANGSTFR